MNGFRLQADRFYDQLEPGSGYNYLTAELHCDTQQHLYEDADKYLK